MVTDFACHSETLSGSRALVTVRGELDMSTSQRFRKTIAQATRRGPVHLVIDLSAVTFMDSSALAVLAAEQRGRDERLHLVVRHPQLLRILEVTGYTRLFAMHDTVEDALQATGRLQSQRPEQV